MKISLLTLAATTALAGAEPLTFRSSPDHTPLLELFTSEGCSSCPPADAWVAKLRAREDLWKAFVPVVFHVDYWNNLGWPDRFSSRDFTLRQHAYAGAWGTSTVYTPELVVDGAEWRTWPHAESVPSGPRRVVGQLELTLRNRTSADVSFSAAENAAAPTQVEFALLGSAETKVRGGENGGKTLRHEFVVLEHGTAPLTREGTLWKAKLTLPASQKAPATAIAAWVNRGTGQPALQATGGWLTP